jgi:ABC-type bacteriocin/lantibiotic exporter with double-glycine peptidase domain
VKRRRGVVVQRQRHDWDCGVAALAMLLGLPYGDVAAAARALYGTTMPTRRGLGIYHLEEMAAALGRTLRRVYKRPGYLTGATGILGMNGGSMCWAGHWVVLKAGVIVDPDGGDVWSVDDYLAETKSRPATLLVEES